MRAVFWRKPISFLFDSCAAPSPVAWVCPPWHGVLRRSTFTACGLATWSKVYPGILAHVRSLIRSGTSHGHVYMVGNRPLLECQLAHVCLRVFCHCVV